MWPKCRTFLITSYHYPRESIDGKLLRPGRATKYHPIVINDCAIESPVDPPREKDVRFITTNLPLLNLDSSHIISGIPDEEHREGLVRRPLV